MYQNVTHASFTTALCVFQIINFLSFFHGALGSVIVTSTKTNTIETYIPDYSARFGPEIPIDGIQGYIVYSHPQTGCTAIDPPPDTPENITWFVLIKRYACNFDEKVRNAQNAGYKAAIVHNTGNNNLEYMSTYEEYPNISIPSCFIGYDYAMEIKERYCYGNNFTLTIIPGVYPEMDITWPYFFAMLAVLVTAIVVIFGCFAAVRISVWLRQYRGRLTAADLRRLTAREFKTGDQYDTCSICLEEFTDGETLLELPCAHVYHKTCIDPWITSNRRKCPVCKRNIFESRTGDTDFDLTLSAEETTPLMRTRPISFTSYNSLREPSFSRNVRGIVSDREGIPGPSHAYQLRPPSGVGEMEPNNGQTSGSRFLRDLLGIESQSARFTRDESDDEEYLSPSKSAEYDTVDPTSDRSMNGSYVPFSDKDISDVLSQDQSETSCLLKNVAGIATSPGENVTDERSSSSREEASSAEIRVDIEYQPEEPIAKNNNLDV